LSCSCCSFCSQSYSFATSSVVFLLILVRKLCCVVAFWLRRVAQTCNDCKQQSNCNFLPLDPLSSTYSIFLTLPTSHIHPQNPQYFYPLGACRISQSQKPNSALGSNHIADVVVIPVVFSVQGYIELVEVYVTGRKMRGRCYIIQIQNSQVFIQSHRPEIN